MTLAANLGFQDYQFRYQTPRGLWRWTTRVDVSLSTPAYTVRDLVTPYGLLRDAIPIPGEVIQAMAQSITDLREAFAPSILLGPESSLVFTVDEGRGWSEGQPMQITNVGPYGSLLGTSITTADVFVKANPANVGNLSANATGSFEVTVDSTNLTSTSSPYASVVTVQDAEATNSPQTFPVTVVVRPKAAIAATPATINFYVTRNVDGTFPAIPAQAMTVQNIGPVGSLLDYQIQKLLNCSDWLVGITPYIGQLASSAVQAVQLYVQPPAGLSTGTFSETLRVSGYSTNSYVDVLVKLTVT